MSSTYYLLDADNRAKALKALERKNNHESPVEPILAPSASVQPANDTIKGDSDNLPPANSDNPKPESGESDENGGNQ